MACFVFFFSNLWTSLEFKRKSKKPQPNQPTNQPIKPPKNKKKTNKQAKPTKNKQKTASNQPKPDKEKMLQL